MTATSRLGLCDLRRSVDRASQCEEEEQQVLFPRLPSGESLMQLAPSRIQSIVSARSQGVVAVMTACIVGRKALE